MQKIELVKQYFDLGTSQTSMVDFTADILLTALFSFLLAKIYEKYGRSLSNRASFARNFVLLSLTTMMVISIIKSSIALSLGLVGALSIVRFRAAIKDPEELVYLFLTMSIGLGFGSGNRYLTTIFFVAISLIIIIKERFSKNRNQNPMFLMINSNKITEIKEITDILDKHVKHLELHRFEIVDGNLEAILSMKADSIISLDDIKNALKKEDKNIEISFTENKGIFN